MEKEIEYRSSIAPHQVIKVNSNSYKPFLSLGSSCLSMNGFNSRDFFSHIRQLSVVVNAYNLNTQEAKAGKWHIQDKYKLHTYLVQAVRAAGKCDAVFKGFSDCLLKLGDSMANYPQGLDDKTNIKTVCTYWEDFHSCTVTALTDCQEGAKDMWDKLRKESKNLNIQGSLFELCGSGNGAAGSLLPALSVLLASLSAALATWLSF
ncbi:hypothetical protein STEG23_017242 [Scotinomys teguina]